MNRSIRRKFYKGWFISIIDDANVYAAARKPEDADKKVRGMLSGVNVQIEPPQPPQRAA